MVISYLMQQEVPRTQQAKPGHLLIWPATSWADHLLTAFPGLMSLMTTAG